MDAPERLRDRITQLEGELARCRAQSEAQSIEVEAAAQALERQYLAQDASLRRVQQEKQDAALQAAAYLEELHREKEMRVKLERELAVKGAELEDAQLKSDLLKQQRVSLLDQIEQRKVEQQELKAALDAYVSKTTNLLEEKLQADRRADEAQLERMRFHNEHSKLQQRITHLEEQITFLESENTAKSRSLLDAQRQAAQEQLASSRQVAELQGQLEAKSANESYLTNLLASKQQLLEEAEASRAQAVQTAAAEKQVVEGQLLAEKESSAALRELYEAGRERCHKLEETLAVLQSQIEEASVIQSEALQKAEAARQAAEELGEKRRQQLEELATAAAAGSPSPRPITPTLQLPPLRPRTPLQPDPELRVVPLHDGLTVQELYTEYMEMACAYQSESTKFRQLQNYMDSVCEQLEGRALSLQKQQEVYNRALQERAQLAASVQTLQDERGMMESKIAQALTQLESTKRRAAALEEQNADTTRQVEVLLAEMERLHGRPVPSVSPPPRKSPLMISADDIINDKLVVFNNVPELLEQHKHMRGMIRSLVQELETTKSSAREDASKIVAERQAQLDQAMASVAADQRRLQEALEVVAAQQEHYKMALANATAEIEKLRGGQGAQGQGTANGGPPGMMLALEGPVTGSARQELDELRQQLETVKQDSAFEVSNLRQQLVETQSKLADVRAQLAGATAAQQQAEARIQDLHAHADVLKQQRMENLQDRQRLQDALGEAEQRLRETHAALDDRAEELFRARTKIAELEQDVARERRSESDASQKLVKLHMESRNEAVELRFQLGQAAARQEALLKESQEAKAKVIALEAEVGRLNSELMAEKSKLSSLKESDVLRIQSSFGLVKQFKEESSSMKQQVVEYQAKLDAEVAASQRLQEAHDTLQDKAGALERQLQQSKDQVSAMILEHTQVVKSQQEELEQLRLELKNKQEIVELGKKQLEAARQEVKFYQLAATTAGSDAATLKAELETCTAELADVRTRLEASQKAAIQAQDSLSKLREERQEATRVLQAELSKVKLQQQSTQSQLSSRESELKEARQQLEFATASHNLDKAALQQANEKLKTAERQLDELAVALEAAQKQRGALQEKVTLSEQAHTREVLALQESLTELKLQAATFKLHSEKVTQDVLAGVTDETVRETVEFLKQQHQLSAERLQALLDDKQKLALERDAALREASEARGQVRNMEELSKKSISPKVHREELEEVEGRVRQLRDEVSRVRAQAQDAETKEAAAKAAVVAKQSEIAALQLQISSLQSALDELKEAKGVHDNLNKQWETRIEQLRSKTNCVEKAEYDRIVKELDSTRKQLSVVEARKASAAVVKSLQRQITELKGKHYTELSELRSASAKKHNDLVRKYNKQVQDGKELRKELEEMKSLSASQQQQHRQQQEQLESRLRELSEARSAEQAVKGQLQASQEQLKLAHKSMEEVKRNMERAVADAGVKAAELEKLREAMEAVQREKTQALRAQALLAGEISGLKSEKQALIQQLQDQSQRPPLPPATLARPSTTPPPATTSSQPHVPPSVITPAIPAHTPVITPLAEGPATTLAGTSRMASKTAPSSSSLPLASTNAASAAAAQPSTSTDRAQIPTPPPSSIPAVPASNSAPPQINAPVTSAIITLAPSLIPSRGTTPATTAQQRSAAATPPTTSNLPSATPSSITPPSKPDTPEGATSTQAQPRPGIPTPAEAITSKPAPSQPPSLPSTAPSTAAPTPTAPISAPVSLSRPPSSINTPTEAPRATSTPSGVSSPGPARPAQRTTDATEKTDDKDKQRAGASTTSGPALAAGAARGLRLPGQTKDLTSMLEIMKKRMAGKKKAIGITPDMTDSAARQAASSALGRSGSSAQAPAQQPSPGIKRHRTESVEAGEIVDGGKSDAREPVLRGTEAGPGLRGGPGPAPPAAKRQKPQEGETSHAEQPPGGVATNAGVSNQGLRLTQGSGGVSQGLGGPGGVCPVAGAAGAATSEAGAAGAAVTGVHLSAAASHAGANTSSPIAAGGTGAQLASKEGDVEMRDAPTGGEGTSFAPRRLFDGFEGGDRHRGEAAQQEDTSMHAEPDDAGVTQAMMRTLQPSETQLQKDVVMPDGDEQSAGQEAHARGGAAAAQLPPQPPATEQPSQTVIPALDDDAASHSLPASSPLTTSSITPPDLAPSVSPQVGDGETSHAHTISTPGAGTEGMESTTLGELVASTPPGLAGASSPDAAQLEAGRANRANSTQQMEDSSQCDISQQSMDQFTALHHLTLTLDAQTHQAGQQHMLGSFPDGMPRYSKPLLFTGTENTHQALEGVIAETLIDSITSAVNPVASSITEAPPSEAASADELSRDVNPPVPIITSESTVGVTLPILPPAVSTPSMHYTLQTEVLTQSSLLAGADSSTTILDDIAPLTASYPPTAIPPAAMSSDHPPSTAPTPNPASTGATSNPDSHTPEAGAILPPSSPPLPPALAAASPAGEEPASQAPGAGVRLMDVGAMPPGPATPLEPVSRMEEAAEEQLAEEGRDDEAGEGADEDDGEEAGALMAEDGHATQEEEQLAASPFDGDEQPADFMTVDLADEEEEEEFGGSDNAELDMEDPFDQDADIIPLPGDSNLEEDAEEDDGEEMDDEDTLDSDRDGDQNGNEEYATDDINPTPVALSRAATSQEPIDHPVDRVDRSVDLVDQAAPSSTTPQDPTTTRPRSQYQQHGNPNPTPDHTAGPAHLQAQDSTAASAPLSSQGGEPRTLSGAPGPGQQDDDGGPDGGDEAEQNSRDPGGRRQRRPIQFDLAPRSNTDPPLPPPASMGPPMEEVPRGPGVLPPQGGRGMLGMGSMLRGGLMSRRGRGRVGRRGGRTS